MYTQPSEFQARGILGRVPSLKRNGQGSVREEPLSLSLSQIQVLSVRE